MSDPVLIAAITTAVVALLGCVSRFLNEKPKTGEPEPSKKNPPQWKVEVVSEEVAEKGTDIEREYSFYSRTYRRCWFEGAAMTPTEQYDERLRDFVVVQLVRPRYTRTSYGATMKTDLLRIGAVEIADPEFDTKIAEFRGYAEERAQTLNALVES